MIYGVYVILFVNQPLTYLTILRMFI